VTKKNLFVFFRLKEKMTQGIIKLIEI